MSVLDPPAEGQGLVESNWK